MSKEIEKWKREDYDNMDTETLIQLLVDKDDYFEELTTPPTEQEVCKALSEFYNTKNKTKIYNFKFEKGDFVSYGKMEMGGRYFLSIAEQPLGSLPPHLVEMIGKFYKGKVKE